MYDTKTARWLVQDPLAEKYYSLSAYNYCVNNPVMFVDPDGKIILSFSGAVIGGGIAILQGESPKRILSATIVGAGQGLFVASGGFLIGMAVGAIGELGEQTLNVKVFEEQSSYDFQAIAISAILGGGSSKFQKLFGGKIDQLATYIDSKYADDAIKKAIRDEILKEKKAYFEPLGKNTKQSLNKDVENRLYELKKGDKYLINILTKIYDIPIIVLEESFPTKSNKSSNE